MDRNIEYAPVMRMPNRFLCILALVALIVIGFAILVAVSIVNIKGDQAGIVTKKLGGGSLDEGRILAVNGENGIQAKVLTPGWKFFYWPWKYDIEKVNVVEIKEGFVGLILAADGKSLPPGAIYAPEWDDPDKMRNAEYFLSEGNGYKGPQLTVLPPGAYRLNTQLFSITQVPITDVIAGHVAVIKSNVGEVSESGERLVDRGYKGIWNTPLGEAQYYLNTNAYQVTIIDTRQVKVSYTDTVEKGERDYDQPMEPIDVRTLDGFSFPVDVRITYQIKGENAPLIVSTIGDDDMVLSKLVTPKVWAIFRNNGEKVKAIDYVQFRSKQEAQGKIMLQESLSKYGIEILEVNIGDIGDKESLGELLKTQTDMEIALQEKKTFVQQQLAAEEKKNLTRTEQEAEEEKVLAKARYGVQVAEQDKKKVIIAAEAEAEQIKTIAVAKAEAYRQIAAVIGEQNAALLEIMKLVAEQNIRITPDVMVGGGSNSGISDALMGTILSGKLTEGAAKLAEKK